MLKQVFGDQAVMHKRVQQQTKKNKLLLQANYLQRTQLCVDANSYMQDCLSNN
jgi:hypothetical protein